MQETDSRFAKFVQFKVLIINKTARFVNDQNFNISKTIKLVVPNVKGGKKQKIKL